jgi:subtilisin family serine protease
VEFAEPNGIARALEYPETLPNDTYINKSRDGITWSKGAWTQTYEDMWGLKKIQANTAWPTSRGDGVVVAVIDSGVDNHSDISGNIWINDDEVPGDGIDNDGNGYIDDCRAWNFLNNNNATIDNFGHGTHVAGTIAALANNGRGIAGVAPQAKIMPIVGLGSLGGSYDTLAACVRYAAENGAHILNCSWGGQLDSQTLKDAFIVAHSRNCVCVAAAGNS